MKILLSRLSNKTQIRVLWSACCLLFVVLGFSFYSFAQQNEDEMAWQFHISASPAEV